MMPMAVVILSVTIIIRTNNCPAAVQHVNHEFQSNMERCRFPSGGRLYNAYANGVFDWDEYFTEVILVNRDSEHHPERTRSQCLPPVQLQKRILGFDF